MKQVEDIIISKRYFELTPSELEMVKELAANEEDYEAMKWFLMSTQTTFSSEQIIPSKDLRKNVMAHLHNQPAQKTIWLNSVAAFMFPSQKKIYQMPALQMAAVAVLLIGVVLMYNGNFKEQDNLALNTPTVESSQIIDETKTNETAPDIVPNKVVNKEIDGLSNQQYVVDQSTSSQESRNSVDKPKVLEDYDAKDLSVAEEVKLNWYLADEKAPGDALGKNSSTIVTNGSTATGYGADGEVVLSSTIQKESDKDERNKKSGNFKSEKSKDEYAVNQSPAMVDDNIALEEKMESEDTGTYKTAMAGGVYRESITLDGKTEVTTKLDTEPPKPQYSIVQSKELKSLFGTFK